MPTKEPTCALRRRGGDVTEANSSSSSSIEKFKWSRTAKQVMADHPDIKPTAPSSASESSSSTATNQRLKAFTSITGTLLHYLLKPFYFLIFVMIHLAHEVVISALTMKTMAQVFFLPHLFPASPALVRILRKDLGLTTAGQGQIQPGSSGSSGLLTKLPNHLAVIVPADSTSEEEEEEWHSTVAQLAQWSVASGIKCLSIMRTDALSAPMVELLQERINDDMADFYKEEPKSTPVVLVRTLRPVEEGVHNLVISGNADSRPLHGGKRYDLDVVILSESDGHDRLAGNVRALGEAALMNKIDSKDVTIDFLDKQLSAELSEPELLIIFKDDLDFSSYPPWHIRLTEIYHHPDQAVVPKYTMFLQALHRYAKCEQRFGK